MKQVNVKDKHTVVVFEGIYFSSVSSFYFPFLALFKYLFVLMVDVALYAVNVSL